MNIGIIVSYFDFRADVRAIIAGFISAGYRVVLFYKASDKKEIDIHTIPGIEYRVICDDERGLYNRLIEYAFLFFKRIPASRNNYFLMELFKVTYNSSRYARWFHRFTLAIQKLGIQQVSYDFLLQHLRFSGKTEISDIDQFLGFTEFQADYFAARLLREKKPLSIYVYSWDHPCKHTRFSRHFSYKVWSEGLRQDLISLQGIPAENIEVCGSSQFTYIHDFLKADPVTEKPFEFSYVYYCCAIGILELIPQEVAIILSLAEELEKCRPDWKLVVRPYPLLKDWGMYDAVLQRKNVVMDDGFRSSPFPDFTAASFDKFRKIKASELVLHSGSTIGLEACFLDTASMLVDFGYGNQRSGLSVYGFIHQFQNEKYLLKAGLGLPDPSQLGAVLDDRDHIRKKCAQVAASFPLLSLHELSLRLIA